MAKGTFDGANRLFIIDSGVTSLDVQIDLYSDWKEWVSQGTNSRFAPMFRTVGGDPTSADQAVGRYFFLLNGWKIRPQEANHTMTIVGNMRVDGGIGIPFVPTLGDFNIIITQEFSNQAVQVFSGSGGFSPTYQEMLSRINLVIRGKANFITPAEGARRIQFLDEDDNIIETHDINSAGRIVT
jgi:hypothetical protein